MFDNEIAKKNGWNRTWRRRISQVRKQPLQLEKDANQHQIPSVRRAAQERILKLYV